MTDEGRRSGDGLNNVVVKAHTSVVATRIQRYLKILIGATALLYVVMFVGTLKVYSISKMNNEGLCALKNDSKERVRQTEQFIRENPKGVAGISIKQLKRSMENSQRTVDSLERVSCSVSPIPAVTTEP